MMQSVVGSRPSSPSAQKTVRSNSKSPVQSQSPALLLSLDGPHPEKSPVVADPWISLPSSITVRTAASNLADMIGSAVVMAMPAASASASKAKDAGAWLWQTLKGSYVAKPVEKPPAGERSSSPTQKDSMSDETWEEVENNLSTPPIGDNV